jgi:polyisoprenoid-binding protein YceI
MIRALIAAGLFLLSSATADATAWQVDAAKSSLNFVVVWAKEPFTASFKKWSADIDFDPADLAHAKANVVIDIASLLSEDPVNDKYRNGPSGLDAAHFAQARFVTKSFRATTPGHYEATADLTIHGITKEVRLPFALTIMGNTAHMTGELTVSRVDFKVGTGSVFGIDWTSERTVSHAVKIAIDLTATRKT